MYRCRNIKVSGGLFVCLPPLATNETITLVHVDELWTSTVKRTPIIKPTIGFAMNLFFAKTSPADLPAARRNASVKNVREHTKTYRSNNTPTKRDNPIIHSFKTNNQEKRVLYIFVSYWCCFYGTHW